MFLQHAQVKLHHVPADQYIRVVLGKPLVKFLQQLWSAGNVFQMKIQRGRIAVRRPEHIDNPLPTALQADAVQFTVTGGFDIQRDPLQRRAIVRVRLQARVHETTVLLSAVHPDGGGDKPLHQKTFRRANVRFVERHARFAEQFFIAHQLAMGAAVEAINRLAVEVF